MSSQLLDPGDASEIAEIVRSSSRLAVRGGGTKPDLVGSEDGVAALTTQRLSGIVEYEPEEYTITALAGTLVSTLEAELRRHGQTLPFDPPFTAEGSTVGGCVATGLSGCGRVRYGGLRDFVLGVRFVDGVGREVRGGGKVVKNAAGFDLAKLMIGSCGGLGVLTEVTFKVFPAPPSTATLTVEAPLEELIELHHRLQSGAQPLAALRVDETALSVRLGGRPAALETRCRKLEQAMGTSLERVEAGDEEEALWASPVLRTDVVTVRVPVDAASGRAILRELELPRTLLGAAVALIRTPHERLEELARWLRDQGLVGQAFCGAAGRLGVAALDPVELRVAGVLDPRGVFVAPGLVPRW